MAVGIKRVAVIGAGWSGLACAVRLAERGAQVTVFEAARTLGGRARQVSLGGRMLDNGQHLLIGAYTHTLALMRAVGVEVDAVLQRMPLTWQMAGEMRLSAPALPAPLHLLAALMSARGLGWGEKWAAVRLTGALKQPVPGQMTVAEFLRHHNQPPRLIHLLWAPLCVAALNTPIEAASSRSFAAVLREALLGARSSSDFLLPKVDLTQAFPAPAAAWLKARGGEIRLGVRITALERVPGGVVLAGHGAFDAAVIATAPHHARSLVQPLTGALDLAFDHEPILTGYLQYPADIRLPAPMLGLAEGMAQWLFDRGQIMGQAGLVAALISARGRHSGMDKTALLAALHQDVARVVPGCPAPVWHTLIHEKRATFACTPGSPKPAIDAPGRPVWLCGDYLDPLLPATLESATRCADQVAAAVMA